MGKLAASTVDVTKAYPLRGTKQT